MDNPVDEADTADHVCGSHNNNRNYGNKSEKRTALWTMVLSWSTILLTIFTAGLFRYAYKQAEDMAEAVLAAKLSADAAKEAVGLDRAWIGTPEIDAIRNDSGFYSFGYTIKNTGKAVINGFYIGAKITDTWREKDLSAFRDYCQTRYPKTNDIYSLVPGDKFAISDDPTNPEIATLLDVGKWKKEHGDTPAAILGCVLYGPRSDGRLQPVVFVGELKIEGGKVTVIRKWSALTRW